MNAGFLWAVVRHGHGHLPRGWLLGWVTRSPPCHAACIQEPPTSGPHEASCCVLHTVVVLDTRVTSCRRRHSSRDRLTSLPNPHTSPTPPFVKAGPWAPRCSPALSRNQRHVLLVENLKEKGLGKTPDRSRRENVLQTRAWPGLLRSKVPRNKDIHVGRRPPWLRGHTGGKHGRTCTTCGAWCVRTGPCCVPSVANVPQECDVGIASLAPPTAGRPPQPATHSVRCLSRAFLVLTPGFSLGRKSMG